MAAAEQSPDVFPWLRTLPLAPEYHPTLAEFQDPISYIFKIEKEASKYGICKIVPPVPSQSKKTTITNLNRSLAARATSSGNGTKSTPTFTTRQQQIGFCPRKPRTVRRPVWQSGEYYTFQQFEAKAKNFEKSYFKKSSKKGLSALEIETLYWKASVDKPFQVEYANDMPGSAFVPVNTKKWREAGEGVTLGETAWNMRGVSRAEGSLLKFMKQEIQGVTSPMVYIAMMFSWFAWHVEDHDLHSLNYLHMGAGKTWYGVPREAAVAFEEVVRVHGYGGEINPLVTFATLGEKTTVMSPEIFISAGIPCCRLVQNPGEFVVTFPRAYHSGFSHGFNCGEAANIATPEWLKVAKDAAIRRASINYPPMVSHSQLLYDLALALSSRIPMNNSGQLRSSRLKDKKKGEGETMVKEEFVRNVIKNNDFLHFLGKGSSIVLLPQSTSNLHFESQTKVKPTLSLGLCSQEEAIEASKTLITNDIMLDRNQGEQLKGFYSVKGNFASLCERNRFLSLSGNDDEITILNTHNKDIERDRIAQGDGKDRRLFSCVTCGILNFDCVAVLHPREAAARYLMSVDCSFINDLNDGSGVVGDGFTVVGGDANTSELNSISGRMEKSVPDGLYDVPIQSADCQNQVSDQSEGRGSDTEAQLDNTALDLLAMTYGSSSDSEEDRVDSDIHAYANETNLSNCSLERRYQHDNLGFPSLMHGRWGGATEGGHVSSAVPLQMYDASAENECGRANYSNGSHQYFDCSIESETGHPGSVELNGLERTFRDATTIRNGSTAIMPRESTNIFLASRSDEDSSRAHVFCLQHAVEAEQQLRPLGGVHIFLFCHPDYPRVEAEAKIVAEELGFDHQWNDTVFTEATKDDEERIQSALRSEEAIPGSGDWAVKLGINLFYSATLSLSPLYSRQMPYNFVIYSAFGRSAPSKSPTTPIVYGKGSSKQKKVVVAGKWCGKVWMSNQVHPLLVPKDSEEREEENRSFHFREEPEEKEEREGEATTPTNKKAGGKRKMGVDGRSIKKAKLTETEDFDKAMDDSAEGSPPQQSTRKLGLASLSIMKSEFNKDSDQDSAQESPPQQSRRKTGVRSTKKPKFTQDWDQDSGHDGSPQQLTSKMGVGRRSIRKTKFTEVEVSDDDSADENPPQQHSRTRVGSRSIRKARSTQVEEFHRASDDSEKDSPPQQPRRKMGLRSIKKPNFKDFDVGSDDSAEDSPQQPRRILGVPRSIKKTKVIEPEDSREHSPPQQPRKRLGVLRSIKKTKVTESENLDDSAEDYPHQQQRRKTEFSVINKAKFTDEEDSDEASDDDESAENSSPQQPIRVRVPRSIKKAKFTEDEPAEESTPTPQQQRSFGKNQNANVEEDLIEGGPSTRLRKRKPKSPKEFDPQPPVKKPTRAKRTKKAPASYKGTPTPKQRKSRVVEEEEEDEEEDYLFVCDMEGCTMTFGSKQELAVHKRNICPVKGCGKKFFSHKYLVQHRRVHSEDRPLKCPWKGCKMSFKWAWARTEHVRVHTGARPYICDEAGCGQTFRFVSDFSRHKRRTGHSVKKRGY